MKKVLIIGAGFLQAFVIKRAKELGYFTIAVDANENSFGFQYADKTAVINIVDKEACLAFAKKEKIDGVLTAATDYGVITTSYIAKEMNLPGLKYEVAELIKNKYRVRKCLFVNHVDDAEQAYEVNADTDISKIAAKLLFPVMVKPCDGSGSRGASRVDEPEFLEKACQDAMDASVTHRAEIESFIVGKEYGAESLVVNGEIHVLAIMQKWMTTPPYYAELGHAIPNDLPEDVENKAINCVTNALKALGVNHGSVNMDMLITKEGKVYIIDIGARMGGNMIGPCVIPYGTGVDYIKAMLAVAVGDEPDFSVKEQRAVATRILAFKKGIINRIPDISRIEKDYDVEIYHHMKVGDRVKEYHINLDGLGYVVSKKTNVKECVEKVEKVKELLEDLVYAK